MSHRAASEPFGATATAASPQQSPASDEQAAHKPDWTVVDGLEQEEASSERRVDEGVGYCHRKRAREVGTPQPLYYR